MFLCLWAVLYLLEQSRCSLLGKSFLTGKDWQPLFLWLAGVLDNRTHEEYPWSEVQYQIRSDHGTRLDFSFWCKSESPQQCYYWGTYYQTQLLLLISLFSFGSWSLISTISVWTASRFFLTMFSVVLIEDNFSRNSRNFLPKLVCCSLSISIILSSFMFVSICDIFVLLISSD